MRTALVTWDFPPRPTGLGRAAGEIAAGLKEAGVHVTVFSFDRTGEGETEGICWIGLGIEPGHPLDLLRRRMGVGHLAAPFRAARSVARASATRGFDVVEATNWYAPAALIDRKRSALVVRNSTPAIDASDPAAPLRDRADLSLAHELEGYTARRADALISNARHHRDAIARWYRLEGHAAHHVVPLSLGASVIRTGSEAPPPFRAEVPSVLFVGRAERRKGFRELIEAFAAVGTSQPVRLLLAGLSQEEFEAGTRGLKLAPPLRSSIEVLGRVSDAELNELMVRADIVAAPSRYESYGLVYREAAAFGRPLLACAEDPSASAFVGEARCGVLAERCTGEAVARAMRELLGDRSAAAALGRNGQRAALGLTRSKLGASTVRVYEEALRRRSGGRGAHSLRPSARP